MRQIIENGAIVVLASPVGAGTQDMAYRPYTANSVFPHRLKIWNVYAGEAAEYETIVSHPASSCSLSFPRNKMSLVIAQRHPSGSLSTSICHDGGFLTSQWKTFFETGKEAPPRDMCYLHIKQAYDAEKFLGEFKLEDQTCEVHIAKYDQSYSIKID